MALHAIGKSWWLVLLRGIFAVLFGVLAFVWPGLTLIALVTLYGLYAIVDGAVALYAALAGGAPVSRWWLLFAGLLGLAIGIVTLAWPGITALALLACIGVWALVRAIFEIVSAIQLRKVIDNEWWLIGSGVMSVLFGLVVLMAPGRRRGRARVAHWRLCDRVRLSSRGTRVPAEEFCRGRGSVIRVAVFSTIANRRGALMMQTFSRLSFMFLVASLAAVPVLAAVQDPKPITESATIQATIEAIDATAKTVTLKGPKGNLVDVNAGTFPRFNQLKVGDVVTATYTESLAVHVRKPGDPAPTAGSAAVTPREGAPGATAAQQRTVSVVVQAIDPKAPSVTVKTTDGRVLSFRIQNPKNLEGVKVGDTVDVTYTQALLLKADPPK